MKKLVLIATLALFTLPATAALAAVPACDDSNFSTINDKGEEVIDLVKGAQQAEVNLRSAGIDAHMTRFWNGCIQTFVKVNGRDEMKFYDPSSLREIPQN